MRRAPHHELRATWLAAAIFAGGALLPPAWASAGPPLCPFRLVTGLPCPGCGLTRSLVSLLHGDVSAAVCFHPLGPVVASVLLALAIVELRRTWQAARSGPSGPASHASQLDGLLGGQRALDRLAWLGVAVTLVVWLLRLPLFLQGRWLF